MSPVVGVGVDAVDVARFRKVLDRRPSFARRSFTESEQSDARGSRRRPRAWRETLRRQEAVMKALGTGIGASR